MDFLPENTHTGTKFIINYQYKILILADHITKSFYKGIIEAGTDETGRGCLAGPVYTAAVILPKRISQSGIDDSKTQSPGTRSVETDHKKSIALGSSLVYSQRNR